MSTNDKNFESMREEYVSKVKTELKFFNFGLPPSPKFISQPTITLEDIAKKYKALKELLIRLNIYIARGDSQEGSINFPEANRIVDYRFTSNIKDNYVRFRSARNINK